jgi:hypothetical protein
VGIRLIYSHFVQNDLKDINNWYRKIDKKLSEILLKNFVQKSISLREILYPVNRSMILIESFFSRNFPTVFTIFTMKIKT